MIKKTHFNILAALGMILLSCQTRNEQTKTLSKTAEGDRSVKLPDSLSSRRVSFVLNLRDTVAEKHWSDFNKNKVEGALVYFNGNKSEIFFPSSNVLRSLGGYKTFSDDYVLADRTDSIPFHFELMVSFTEADSTKFYFEHPVEQFLSVEETGNYIESVQSTEMWSAMVIHEMFHHFQYNTPAFLEYAKNTIGPLPYDIRNLTQLCQENEDFLESIRVENEYLLKAIAQDDNAARLPFLKKYLQERKLRISSYGENNPHLEQVENYYIIQEGSARYIEYKSMLALQDLAHLPNPPQIFNDPKFKKFSEFAEMNLSDEAFNYLTYAGPSTYHYALGFNTMRLLDILGVDYKDDLLDNPEKPLHSYLEDYLSKS